MLVHTNDFSKNTLFLPQYKIHYYIHFTLHHTTSDKDERQVEEAVTWRWSAEILSQVEWTLTGDVKIPSRW